MLPAVEAQIHTSPHIFTPAHQVCDEMLRETVLPAAVEPQVVHTPPPSFTPTRCAPIC